MRSQNIWPILFCSLVVLIPEVFARKATAPVALAPVALGPRYLSKEKGFSIALPKGWEIKEKVMGSSVIAVIPSANNNSDQFRENINVVVEPLPQAMNTKTYFTESMKVLKKLFTDFKLEKSGHGPLDRQVATNDKTDTYWSVFTHRMGKVRAKVMQYMMVKGNQAYVITCSAAPGTFDKLRPVFEASAKSFKIN
jgi:hypothetical protein